MEKKNFNFMSEKLLQNYKIELKVILNKKSPWKPLVDNDSYGNIFNVFQEVNVSKIRYHVVNLQKIPSEALGIPRFNIIVSLKLPSVA